MTTPMAAHRRNARGPKLRLLPVLLKEHGASHKEIGVIVGSFNAIRSLLIRVPLGCYSRVGFTTTMG